MPRIPDGGAKGGAGGNNSGGGASGGSSSAGQAGSDAAAAGRTSAGGASAGETGVGGIGATGSSAGNAGGTGGRGTGGKGGATGGSGTAGISGGDGGSAGAGVGGGVSVGAHCSPGTLLKDPIGTYSQGNVEVCYSYPEYDGGVSLADDPFIRGIKVTGMQADHPFALSIVLLHTPVPKVEFWGSEEMCGGGTELIWAGSLPAGTDCITLHPKKAHPNLLMVWGPSGGQHTDITLCPEGTCP